MSDLIGKAKQERKCLISLLFKRLRVRVLLISKLLNTYMVVNFRAREIS